MPSDVDQIDTPIKMRTRLIRREVELRRIANKNLQQAERRYKWEHDKKGQFEPTFMAGDYRVSQKYLTRF